MRVRTPDGADWHGQTAQNGKFWDKVKRNADVGVEVQLMHDAGDRCPLRATVNDFSVIDTNGTHVVRLHYCECSRGVHVDRYNQLMRAKLWPATPDNPKMATTFEALDQFSRLTLLGRLTAYDYHKALVAATDAMGILGLPVRDPREYLARLGSDISGCRRCTRTSRTARTNSCTSTRSNARAGRTRRGALTRLPQERPQCSASLVPDPALTVPRII